MLAELENIDDECDQNDIAFVKIDDDKEAEEWGIDEIPTIVNKSSLFNCQELHLSIRSIFVFDFRYSLNVVFHTSMKVI